MLYNQTILIRLKYRIYSIVSRSSLKAARNDVKKLM